MTTPQPTRQRLRSTRGGWVIVAMFALGGAVLWGLYQAPRARAPASPQVPWAAPHRPLRVVSVDADAGGETAPTVEQILAAVRPLDADFVLLQRVRSEDAAPLAEGLAMQRTFHPQCFQALGTRPRGPIGCLVLSKHPLYDARPLRREAPGSPCFGVRVVAVVEGSRFSVVSARPGDTAAPATDRELAEALRAPGSPPTMTGVADAGSRIVADAAWTRTREGAVPLGRAAASIRWADLTAANGTIRPSTQAAP